MGNNGTIGYDIVLCGILFSIYIIRYVVMRALLCWPNKCYKYVFFWIVFLALSLFIIIIEDLMLGYLHFNQSKSLKGESQTSMIEVGCLDLLCVQRKGQNEPHMSCLNPPYTYHCTVDTQYLQYLCTIICM